MGIKTSLYHVLLPVLLNKYQLNYFIMLLLVKARVLFLLFFFICYVEMLGLDYLMVKGVMDGVNRQRTGNTVVTKTKLVSDVLNLTAIAQKPGFLFKDYHSKTVADIRPPTSTFEYDPVEFSTAAIVPPAEYQRIENVTYEYQPTAVVSKYPKQATLSATPAWSTIEWATETHTYRKTNQTLATATHYNGLSFL